MILSPIISTMGFPILVRQHLYTGSGPRASATPLPGPLFALLPYSFIMSLVI